MSKKNITNKDTFNFALKNLQKRKFKVAGDLFRKVLKKNPNDFQSIFFLGSMSVQNKNFNEAIKLLTKAIEIQPNHPSANHNLSVALVEMAEFRKAFYYSQKAIQLQPNHLEAYNNLGNILKELGDLPKAISCYEKAIQLKPNFIKGYNNLGNILKELGDLPKAISCYEKAIQIQPNHINAHYNLALIFKSQGNFTKVADLYEKILKHDPENLIVIYDLINLKKIVLDNKLKNKINKIMKNRKCTNKNTTYGNFILSRYEYKNKNYKKELKYLLTGHKSYFESERNRFTRGNNYWLNKLPKEKKIFNLDTYGNSTKKITHNLKPIFIIGFPRCGSTLVEKIIASTNQQILIGEETNILTSVIANLINQNDFLEKDIDDFEFKIFQSYEKKGLIDKENNFVFTDKTLDNFYYINVIKKIFPLAKIVNCKRNPVSSIVSLLKNNMPDISWAHNLEDIFKFYDNYNSITKKFIKKYPNFIYELEYEKFVSNPLLESKQLISYCNLKWNKKCLKFYKRKDLVSNTASNVQIRKAIYTDSIEKYLPYKKLLKTYGSKYDWFKL